MNGLTRQAVASEAGVDDGFVDRLCDLGVLAAPAEDAFTEGDVRRARIMHALDRAGMPMDAIGEATRRGAIDLSFIDDAAYELFAGPSDVTFRAMSERSSVPLDLLRAIREAMGSALPEPDDRMRPMELEAVPALELQIAEGVRPQVIERMLRAYGESMRRIAEVEADWWMSDVLQPILDAGGSMAEVGPQTREFSNEFAPRSDRLILALLHGHQSNAWLKNFFEGFENALEQAGLHNPADTPPAISFLDLSGYTRLTDEQGDVAAADLAGRLSRLVQRTSSQHGGRPIKWLGDGVMFWFREPAAAVVAALEMVEGAGEAGLPPAHVGVHAGPVLFQEGDYFGRTVNVASRVGDYARRGEVLVTDDVVAASGGIEGVRFEPIGPVELKGLTEAIPLNVARRAGSG